jgi:predicted LPLAT superfamily acyltransferase
VSRHWLNYGERSNALALRAITWIALRLGRPAARAVLYPVSLYFLLFAPAIRRASQDYLPRVIGRRPGFRDVFRHIYSFSAITLDRVFMLTGHEAGLDIRTSGVEAIDALLEQHRGAILLGAHLGSFEAARASARKRPDLVVRLLMYPENARKIGALFEGLDPGLKDMIIPLGRPESLIRIQECLARGEFVGILGDRVFREGKTIRHEFLGQEAVFPLGPLEVACALRVPVVLMFGLYRGGRRYDVHFELLSEALPADRLDRAAEVQRSLCRYVERLEHYCRLAPYNWFNFYEYWDTQDVS